MRATGGLAAIRRGVAGLLPRVPLLLLLLLGPAAAPAQAPAAEALLALRAGSVVSTVDGVTREASVGRP